MISLKSAKDNELEWQEIYSASFPEKEQMPIKQLFKMSNDETSNAHAAFLNQNDNNVGIVYYVTSADETKAFILYLAINSKFRGGGYGSQVVQFLINRFSNGIILECEMIDDQADNSVERKRRYDFYLRNGMQNSGILSDTLGGTFYLLRSSIKIDAADYLNCLKTLELTATLINVD